MKTNNYISLTGLTMMAIGACIGSGIFVTPAQSVQALPHQGLVLLTWLVGGVVSCLGALSFSELGARFPKAGGVYVYLREAFGDLAGFLYGWIILLIVNTGALAALSITLADYTLPLLGIDKEYNPVFAIAIIWILTIINLFGVNISEVFSKIFTGLKLFAIGCIILAGLIYAKYTNPGHEWLITAAPPPDPLKGIFLTFVGVFWSMGGWHHATYLAGETIQPQKNVPKAMIIGTAVVTVVYVLTIFSYMCVLDIGAMQESNRIASDMLANVWSYGGIFVSVAIIISITGTIGIYTMTAPRIYFAMAEDKIFFKFLSVTNRNTGTPVNAMLFQSAWATLLILAWGSFIKVITFVTFMDIVFMALACSTIFYFRIKRTDKSPFHVPFYPTIPALYLLVTIGFVLYTGWQLESESVSGILILVSGIPAYYWFKAKNKK